MAQSERGGATVGFTSLAPPEGSIAAVRSIKVSSAAGIVPEVGAVVEISPRDLFDVLVQTHTKAHVYCKHMVELSIL